MTNSKSNTWFLWCIAGAVDIAEFLIQLKASVNALDINKESPLHWAIAYGMIW